MIDAAERAILKGKEAQQVLDSPVIQEAFAEVERELIQAWKITPAADPQARERLWIGLKMLGKIKDHLSGLVGDGLVTAARLEDERAYKTFDELNRTVGEEIKEPPMRPNPYLSEIN